MLAGILVSTFFAMAQPTGKSLVPYPETELRHLPSSIVGDEFEIYIALPPDYHATKQAYPVLYFTDANMFFAALTQIARAMLQPGIEELRPFILVGVGYRIDSLIQWATLRSRDLTPTTVPDMFPTGDGPRFMKFVKEELMPFVKKNYRASTEAAYAGFSYGGLFGLYVLFHEPELFQRYIIASPWMSHDNLITFKYEATYASKHTDLPATVFMCAGALEETVGAVTEVGMLKDLNLLAATLQKRRYPSLKLKTHVFENETHVSVPGASFSRGLRAIFAK